MPLFSSLHVLYDDEAWQNQDQALESLTNEPSKCFKNPRSQGVSRFQSREELVNSVGK